MLPENNLTARRRWQSGDGGQLGGLGATKNDCPPLLAQRNATLSVGNLLRSSYLLYFSQPAADRHLFKAMKGKPIRSIVELGIDLPGRTERLLEVAAWRADCLPLRYTGIDPFDSRPASQPKLSLKQAFAQLRPSGAKVQLVPGEPFAALSRVANSLSATDLLLISLVYDKESLSPAWKYVPRMLGPHSLVYVQEPGSAAGKETWRPLQSVEITSLAAQATQSLRRSA
jgi:hypothetical protein